MPLLLAQTEKYPFLCRKVHPMRSKEEYIAIVRRYFLDKAKSYGVAHSERIIPMRLIYCICFMLLPFLSVVAQTEEGDLPQGDSFLFSFMPGEADIQAGYGNNTIEMERLNRKIWPVINPLVDGEYHLLIVSHVFSETGAISKTAINTAAWRASMVRRYLKNKYELDNRNISFYVDRSGGWGNSVHVYLLYFPMPEFANRQIFFSTDQSLSAISASLKRYTEPPYIYVMNDPDLTVDQEPFAYVVVNNKAELPYEEGAMVPVVPPTEEKAQTVATPAPVVATATQPQRTPKKAKQKVVAAAPVQMIEPQEQPRMRTEEVASFTPSYPTYQPFNLTVRTNLLSWATLTPGFSIGKEGASMATGSTMPNLELEYAFGGWGSVVLGGTYARFSYKGNPNNLWGLSSVLLEPRLWFDDDGAYRGFNVGLQLKYGNFNVRDNQPEGYGRTGQFFTAGVMLNYLQPIVQNLAIEAGVGFGSRMVFNASVYERDYAQQISQTIESYSQTNFMINLRLALVYRFGFY